ncbi:virion protein [Idiomarina seosinensis]|uniref:virion protein n=1 Tax=Idiomarina seosinensis TaxID=281739 RepID=UPI00384AD385
MTLNSSQPRGLRNNNPGNLRGSDAFKWQGEMGRDNKDFVVFDTPENGLRALARILQTYRNRYGLNTIEGVLSRYAPPSENNTESYIKHAVRAMGLSRHTPLTGQDYPRLMAVIVAHENGQQPFSLAQLTEGYKRGFV